jgi:adenine-specific DNA-methyltransferase
MPLLHWLTRDDDINTAARMFLTACSKNTPSFPAGTATPATCSFRATTFDALKALLPYYAGKVKCIFIDPPYNTRSAFEHYDDNLEHAQWLAMMYPRLELLRSLLAEDGSIWVTIDHCWNLSDATTDGKFM